jgi:hypothetical protein
MRTDEAGTWADRQQLQVTSWRRRRLLDAGFGIDLAEALAADRRADLHALLELVERGCPPALAARILAPADGDGLPR